MADKVLTKVVRPGDIEVFPFSSGPAPEKMMAMAEERTDDASVEIPHCRVKGNIPDGVARQAP